MRCLHARPERPDMNRKKRGAIPKQRFIQIAVSLAVLIATVFIDVKLAVLAWDWFWRPPWSEGFELLMYVTSGLIFLVAAMFVVASLLGFTAGAVALSWVALAPDKRDHRTLREILEQENQGR